MNSSNGEASPQYQLVSPNPALADSLLDMVEESVPLVNSDIEMCPSWRGETSQLICAFWMSDHDLLQGELPC